MEVRIIATRNVDYRCRLKTKEFFKTKSVEGGRKGKPLLGPKGKVKVKHKT